MRSELKELLILHFLNDGVRTAFVILLPFIAKDLSLSLTQVGFLGSSQPLLAAILALPTGYLMSKLKGFQMILFLLILYSVSAIVVSQAPNLFFLIFIYLVASFGFGMFHTVGFSLTARASSPTDAGKNMGTFTAVGDIGRITIPTAAVFLTSFVGWRITMVIVGALGIVLFFIFRFVISSKDVQVGNDIGPQHYKEFLKDIAIMFREKHALSIAVTAIIDSLASNPIYVYLPFLLVSKGITPTELSIIMGGFFIGSLLGKSLLGRLVDKFGNKTVFIISEICMATSLLLIAFVNLFFLFLLLGVLLGTFTKGTSPVIQTMFSRLSHKDHYHKVFAISELVTGFASMLSIVVMGAVADRIGLSWVFYSTAFLALIASLPIIFYSKLR